MTTSALDRALTESSLRPLPAAAAELLLITNAQPRLAAHLRAVHDVAWTLTDRLGRGRPDLEFDTTSVLFGAATHDIGKTIHSSELSQPGHLHEDAGRELLLSYGVPWHLARFAGTHGSSWHPDSTGVDLEDLLVSLADQVWKGARVPELEERVGSQLGAAPWEAFMILDDLIQDVAAGADTRLAFQSAFPVS
ncbi:HD domain-containing protein [Winogradskya consettensis]|uniref:Phosphohydrolase n=1 Tax=Winogradskya consettensis TaxID=113560 RepID=A0A919VX71_9ACTN|nr:HD domain-containing protein [Actinoplanes consettensis]GIM80351.1 phosphohydrolase [Actinoplanes consettensis]